MTKVDTRVIGEAANAIIQADGLIIAAGAGLGVDSGLPDFRGQQGFWKAYPALAEAGLEFTEIANPLAFSMSPKLAWGFYGHRLNLYRKTIPHEGFHILKQIADRMPNGFQVFTSNVDGQFQKAGFNENKIYECHGSIHHLQCAESCRPNIWSADSLIIETDDVHCLAVSELPTCPYCREFARPNILMFDDFNWQSERADSQRAKMTKNIQQMQSPVIIELGAGESVATVRYFSESQPGKLIRINPRDFDVPNGGLSVKLGALEGLTLIVNTLSTLGYFEN
ncbi:NAD-dependent deacetylase [Aliikangiella marina]|uniref:protein acetyllysine N-acetyltransferase n=1 Tax=Aliikangiella marina TaxID=1712262 RepID=A0A545TCZ8_9GAMM|nr:Sir2 family NAD-dependent protein deacetylase [Aliikangiella marina]TQV75087.1 NAD-dependent deacetylase [Aliikangiella marina]